MSIVAFGINIFFEDRGQYLAPNELLMHFMEVEDSIPRTFGKALS